jgi:hypothetical protein
LNQEIAMHTILPKPLPIPPATLAFVNSAPRQALDEFHKKRDEFQSRIAAAREPIDATDAKIAAERENLKSAESELDSAIVAEATIVIERGHGAATDYADVVQKAQARVDRTKRVIATLESQRAQMLHALNDFKLHSEITDSARDKLVADVAAEEADRAFDEMVAAHAAAALAEAKHRTLVKSISDRKWYRLAETLNERFSKTRLPTWHDQKFPDWAAFFAALSIDASTPIPAVQS